MQLALLAYCFKPYGRNIMPNAMQRNIDESLTDEISTCKTSSNEESQCILPEKIGTTTNGVMRKVLVSMFTSKLFKWI